jgi:ABC-2 type transport system permease protein
MMLLSKPSEILIKTQEVLRMKIFMALAKKEFYQIVRDPSSIMIAFILPFMFILLFAFGISLDSNKFNIGLLVQDNSVDAQNFATELKHNRFYNVKVGSDMKMLERELIAGKIRGIITIPPDFSERLNNPDRKVQIYVIADGAEPNIANSVKGYANGIFLTWLSGRPKNVGIKKPLMVSVEERYWIIRI